MHFKALSMPYCPKFKLLTEKRVWKRECAEERDRQTDKDKGEKILDTQNLT